MFFSVLVDVFCFTFVLIINCSMKKYLFILFSFVSHFSFVSFAQIAPDSVVMTVAGKSISIDEFKFFAKKNSQVDMSNKESIAEFVELFKNFKLKVAEAEAEGLNNTRDFKKELEKYKYEVHHDFLSDTEGEEAAARRIYDQKKELLSFNTILFKIEGKQLSKDTVAMYKVAQQAYERIMQGESVESVGKELMEADKEQNIRFEHIQNFQPLTTYKAFESIVYGMKQGEISKPFRNGMGFNIVQMLQRTPNPGKRKVAHILLPLDSTSSQSVPQLVQQVYAKAKAGDDFASLAKTYSIDKTTADQGGVLPSFGMGRMVDSFEKASFALQTPGEISAPIRSNFGYHIIKLIAIQPLPAFDKEKNTLLRELKRGEHNFEIYKKYDDRLKKEYGYKPYPEAYAEMQALCNEHFPSDKDFYEAAKDMKKTLFHLNGTDFPQSEFAYYLQVCPFSTKPYAGDFMREVYELFIRDIMVSTEKKQLESKHPEIKFLINEYRDGLLLFEISNKHVWSKPMNEQAALEEAWIKELNKKYPVKTNKRVLDRIRKESRQAQ